MGLPQLQPRRPCPRLEQASRGFAGRVRFPAGVICFSFSYSLSSSSRFDFEGIGNRRKRTVTFKSDRQEGEGGGAGQGGGEAGDKVRGASPLLVYRGQLACELLPAAVAADPGIQRAKLSVLGMTTVATVMAHC